MPQGEHLHVTGLTKTFGRRRPVQAVRDLTFEVASGRVTGFLGPNGSGKTTTLRCLLGLVSPTSGTRPMAWNTAPPTVLKSSSSISVPKASLKSSRATEPVEAPGWQLVG